MPIFASVHLLIILQGESVRLVELIERKMVPVDVRGMWCRTALHWYEIKQ